MTCQFNIWLTNSKNGFELFKTHFVDLNLGIEATCYRGNGGPRIVNGSYIGSFKWTKGVQGMLILFLKASLNSENENNGFLASIHGGPGSVASSLDYALDNRATWLNEIFGGGVNNYKPVNKLFNRFNPRRKWNGPITVQLTNRLLNSQDINIFLCGQTIIEEHHLQTLISSFDSQHPIGTPLPLAS